MIIFEKTEISGWGPAIRGARNPKNSWANSDSIISDEGTIMMNYSVIKDICNQRKGHKLEEWHKFIEWAKTLPYSESFIFDSNYTGIEGGF